MRNIVGKITFSIALLCILTGPEVIFPSQAEAALSVIIKNETGYDLEEVKYVREIGDAKSLVGESKGLANGGSHTFVLKEGGVYRVYASFTMASKKVYAKGNANNLQDGAQYMLTLKKVVISEGGASLKFIDQGEFDAIK
jgi:hypothetical protein